MNTTIKRYSAADVPEAGRPGFWVHAGDFNQAMELAANREAALQQRLNIADQRVCDLTWLAKSAYMEGWEMGWVTRHTDANNEKRVTPWAPPREVMEREWLSSEGRTALNKSALPATVDCGNCAFVEDVCITECESKKIRDAQVKP